MSQEEPHVELSIRQIQIPTETGEDIDVDFDEFPPPNDPNFEESIMDAVGLMKDEKAPSPLWVRLVEEIWRFGKYRIALEVLEIALEGKFI